MLRGKKIKKGKKEQICKVKQVDKEDLYILKINCKGKRTVGKANKGINVEKNNNRFKKLNSNQKREREEKKRKIPQNDKVQCRGRGLQQ